jgi:DNA-binding NarL/FixJ family response regulator
VESKQAYLNDYMRAWSSSRAAGAENLVLRTNLERLVPAALAALWVRHPLKRLSPRQLEVLRLVTDGWTTREIAQRLRLSVKTVETHRGSQDEAA